MRAGQDEGRCSRHEQAVGTLLGTRNSPHDMEVVMKRNLVLIGAVVTVLAIPRSGLAQAPAGLDTAAIEQASGLKGQVIAEENVFKVGKPRTDVKINVDGW